MIYTIKRFSWLHDKRNQWAQELADSMTSDLKENKESWEEFNKTRGLSSSRLSKNLDPGDEVAVFNIPASFATGGKVQNSSFASTGGVLNRMKGKKKVLFPTKTLQAWREGTPQEQEWAREAVRLEELLKEASTGKDRFVIIRDPETRGVEVDAHEMGHVKRFQSFSALPVILLRVLGNDIDLKGAQNLSTYVKKHRNDSFFTMLRHYIASYGIQTDEAKASEEALTMLRKAGATDRQIEVARRNLGLAGKTYKVEDLSWKAPLYWKLQTSDKLDRKSLKEAFPKVFSEDDDEGYIEVDPLEDYHPDFSEDTHPTKVVDEVTGDEDVYMGNPIRNNGAGTPKLKEVKIKRKHYSVGAGVATGTAIKAATLPSR